jgi:hypothetical protein
VLADLDGRIDWIIDGGPCALGIESTVVDARGAEPRILREGVITREMLGPVQVPGHRTSSLPARRTGGCRPHGRRRRCGPTAVRPAGCRVCGSRPRSG